MKKMDTKSVEMETKIIANAKRVLIVANKFRVTWIKNTRSNFLLPQTITYALLTSGTVIGATKCLSLVSEQAKVGGSFYCQE